MCFKPNQCGNELDAVKSMMTLSMDAVMMAVFDKEPDEILPGHALVADLEMDAEKKQHLSELIAEYFNGVQPDFNTIITVENLFDFVVNSEFDEVGNFMEMAA